METPIRRREQEVWQACDDLWALSGDYANITGDAIRERLLDMGKSRGSPNELYRYRKTWAQARNINNNSPLNPIENDPIIRAVSLVHEQLKHEAATQIHELNQTYKKELEEKDVKISQLIKELKDKEQELSKQVFTLKETSEKLEAEISIRLALEERLKESKISYENSLSSMKDSHAQALIHLKSMLITIEQTSNARLINEQEEKKRLGLEYSENLVTLKYEKQTEESKSQKALLELEQKNNQIIENQEKERALSVRVALIMSELDKLKYIKEEKDKLEKNLLYLNKELTKRDIKIARYRAYLDK